MKTDRELLELAAKAAGMDYLVWTPGNAPIVPAEHRVSPQKIAWHPLSDDGDALRLAVKLQMDLYIFDSCAGAVTAEIPEIEEDAGNDIQAAVRRVIVRVAAEIGESMNV